MVVEGGGGQVAVGAMVVEDKEGQGGTRLDRTGGCTIRGQDRKFQPLS